MKIVALAGAFLAVVGAARAQQAAPAVNIGQIGAALLQCLQRARFSPPPSIVEARILFSLRRDGSMIGEPRIVAMNASAAPAFEALMKTTLPPVAMRCAPFAIDSRLGSQIAGRLLTFRMKFNPNGRTGVSI